MQEILEESIRGVGFVALKVVTLGRYRGGAPGDRLPEGAVGFAIVLATLYVAYAIAA